MKQTNNSNPSTVQLENLMDNPKLLISHLYAQGSFGSAIAVLLEILANHNLDSFKEEVRFYMPKPKKVETYSEEQYALSEREEMEQTIRDEESKYLNGFGD